MRATSSANLRRARINSESPHLTPKLSLFISSIRALMNRLKKLGQPCLTPEVTGIGLEMVSLIQTKYSVLLFLGF